MNGHWWVQVSYTDDGGYENSDFEDSEAERRERAKLQKEIVPAFMSSHEGLDDEVERVLGHRWNLALSLCPLISNNCLCGKSRCFWPSNILLPGCSDALGMFQ